MRKERPSMDWTRSPWRPRRDGDSYVIDGAKRWIGNGSIADVVVVWARDTSDDAVKAFLVEKGAPGYNATVITGKASMRAIWMALGHAGTTPARPGRCWPTPGTCWAATVSSWPTTSSAT